MLVQYIQGSAWGSVLISIPLEEKQCHPQDIQYDAKRLNHTYSKIRQPKGWRVGGTSSALEEL